MSKLPKPSRLPIPISSSPRSSSAQDAKRSVDPLATASEVEARTSGSMSAHPKMDETRSTKQPSKGVIPPTRKTKSDILSSKSGTSKPLRKSSAGTKQIESKTKVTITKPTGEKRTMVQKNKTSSSTETDLVSMSKTGFKGSSKICTSATPTLPSSILRKQVALHVKGQAAKAPMGCKVTAVASRKSSVPPLEKIMTPAGPQQIVQKIITEKRVERSRHGEMVSRNIKTIETNARTGETLQIEEEFQQLNPDYPASEGPLKEIVTIVSEKDVTEGFETRRENVIRETIKLDADVGFESAQVVRLVEEETEDVENILLCTPPDLVNRTPALYPLQKRLNALRLSPENIAMIEKSLINPSTTADEVLPERTPEIMARVMETSAKVYIPNTLPRRIFYSLFGTDSYDDPMMTVSSAAPGPLRDVVVPTSVPEMIHEEMLSRQMEETSVIVHTTLVKPPKDNFVVAEPTKPRKRDMQLVFEAVGALPKSNIIPTNIKEAKTSGKFSKALARGIEYVIDADSSQYCSKVQLRGTQPPPWFPGYMVALSNTSNIVGIAKSPSQVLFSAWKSVQPDVFPDDSIVYN